MCILESTVRPMHYLQLLLSPFKQITLSLLEFPIIKAIFALLLTTIGIIISDNFMGLAVLIGLVLVDQFTGVWIGLKNRTFNSFSFRNGIIKLLFYVIIVACFYSLEYISPVFKWLELDNGAIAWLAVTELISIVENSCIILNIPFPNWIIDKLKLFVKFGKLK